MNNRKIKNQRKTFILICLIILVLAIYGMIRIYALFHSELNAKIEFKNGAWNILINETDITTGADITFMIDNVTTNENQHVKPGNLAPGLTGNFKIRINPTDTDVSIKYEVSLEENELNNSNLKIKSITETQEGNELIRTGENTYTGIITLEKIKAGYKNEITVEIEWVDDENNNETDTELGTIWDFEYQIPITVHVCQYFGEELNIYTEN